MTAGFGVPHSPQNLLLGPRAPPHWAHAAMSLAPHSSQYLRAARFSAPHVEQTTPVLASVQVGREGSR